MNARPLGARAVFLIGPPGVGKTTIGIAAAARLGRRFQTIDDWVRTVYQHQGSAMTDEQVDAALSLLFLNLVEPAVCEFAHHDYLALLASNRYPVFDSGQKIALVAPLTVCLQRIAERGRFVRSEYVERSWQSTQALVDSWPPFVSHCQLVLNTTAMPLADSIERVVQFVSEEEGRTPHATSQR